MGFKRPRVRISTLGPKKQKEHLLFLLFSFVSGFEKLNASVRWTLARCGLDRIGSIVFRISTLEPHIRSISFFCFFFSGGEIRMTECNTPVGCCLPPAGRRQHISVPNLDTRTRKSESRHTYRGIGKYLPEALEFLAYFTKIASN